MKHLKIYEEQNSTKEWLIIQNQSSKSHFLLHITNSDKNYIYYDKYIILTMKDTYLNQNYLTSKRRLDINDIYVVFQSDNESDCIEYLKKIIEFKKYNL